MRSQEARCKVKVDTSRKAVVIKLCPAGSTKSQLETVKMVIDQGLGKQLGLVENVRVQNNWLVVQTKIRTRTHRTERSRNIQNLSSNLKRLAGQSIRAHDEIQMVQGYVTKYDISRHPLFNRNRRQSRNKQHLGLEPAFI